MTVKIPFRSAVKNTLSYHSMRRCMQHCLCSLVPLCRCAWCQHISQQYGVSISRRCIRWAPVDGAVSCVCVALSPGPHCTVEDDESVFDFARRRFGSDVATYMIDPLCVGIYGGNARALSLQACFPSLADLEKYVRIHVGSMFP